MDDLTLAIPSESLSQSESGPIYGQVYFQLGREAFPGRGWSDLAVAFMCAWIAALMRLIESGSQSERVRFMDGPYWAELSKSRGTTDAANIGFVRDRLQGPILEHSAAVDLSSLLQDAIRLGEEVLCACRHNGWSNGDIWELAETLNAASEVARRRTS
jgi:hypothetical protein